MHDALRQRLLRRIESLPDQQVYQVLDFIEFLESKYSGTEPVEASGLQRFAESLEDKLRKKAVSPNTIREAFQLISAADRVLHGVSSAGKQILSDLNQALEVPEGEESGGEGTSGPRERSGGRGSGTRAAGGRSGGGSPRARDGGGAGAEGPRPGDAGDGGGAGGRSRGSAEEDRDDESSGTPGRR